jgi:GTP-binding protein
MEKVIAIVGRPNVGKSALFNRIAKRQISLVYDRPGVTRDRITAACRWRDFEFTLVDTGGIGLEDSEGFAAAIAREVEIALLAATDIILVVDARDGMTSLDKEVAQHLRKSKKKKVWVAANKMDHDKQANFEAEFVGLGFGTPFPTSAEHGLGIEDLLEAVTEGWEPVEVVEGPKEERATRLVIVGRPNVGKSSLINALVQDTRAIVSEIAGTTRDAVDVPFVWKGQPFLLIDTAGMRQERRMRDQLETHMTGRSAHAINRADVCILVIDSQTGVSMQDKKIAGLIQEAGAPCIIAVNKWDLARNLGDAGKAKEREYFESVRQDLFFISYAPVLFVSAKTQERLDGLLKAAQTIATNRRYRFLTSPLNRVIHKAQERLPAPLVKGKRLKIYYAAQQTDDKDKREIPTILLFVNDPKCLTSSYQRYLEEQLRESFPLEGCPIKFVLRARTQKER